MTAHEHSGRVMGARLHLLISGPRHLVDYAELRLIDLESKWSRFLPDSELSRINAADGSPVLSSPDTVLLVGGLRDAWEASAGRFDPTVHDAVVAAGYDAPWPNTNPRAHLCPMPGTGCRDIDVHPATGLVQLPAGMRIDPGGLGKGLAADMVCAELLDRGASGALVSVGGDLRVAGEPPTGDSWRIDVEHPDDPAVAIARIELRDGGVATSTSQRRRWTTAGGVPAHHLIDPRTGLPAHRPWRQVTTVAGTAAWAEVAAKVTFLDGAPNDPLTSALILGATDDDVRIIGDPTFFSLPAGAGAAARTGAER